MISTSLILFIYFLSIFHFLRRIFDSLRLTFCLRVSILRSSFSFFWDTGDEKFALIFLADDGFGTSSSALIFHFVGNFLRGVFGTK